MTTYQTSGGAPAGRDDRSGGPLPPGWQKLLMAVVLLVIGVLLVSTELITWDRLKYILDTITP